MGFSVIIPTYNQSEYLSQAIESVLQQEHPPHELIVVDDGSTDHTAEIAQGFGTRLKYIKQRRAGVSAARNYGAEQASGEWLAFLDADDWFYPCRLKRHADWIERDRDLDFLIGDYDFCDSAGCVFTRSMERSPSGRALLEKANDASEAAMTLADFQGFFTDYFAHVNTLSLRRSKYLAVGGCPLGYRIGEDYFLFAKLCATSSRIGVVCTPLAAYRIHEEGAMRSDRLRTQLDDLSTLTDLRALSRSFPSPIKRGIARRLRDSRRNLGHIFVRNGQRVAAMKAVLPTIWENPGFGGIRDLISMARG